MWRIYVINTSTEKQDLILVIRAGLRHVQMCPGLSSHHVPWQFSLINLIMFINQFIQSKYSDPLLELKYID